MENGMEAREGAASADASLHSEAEKMTLHTGDTKLEAAVTKLKGRAAAQRCSERLEASDGENIREHKGKCRVLLPGRVTGQLGRQHCQTALEDMEVAATCGSRLSVSAEALVGALWDGSGEASRSPGAILRREEGNPSWRLPGAGTCPRSPRRPARAPFSPPRRR